MFSEYELDEMNKILDNVEQMYRFLESLDIDIVNHSDVFKVKINNLDRDYIEKDNKYIFEFPIQRDVDNRKISELSVEEFKEVQKKSTPIYEADDIMDEIDSLLGVSSEFSLKAENDFPLIVSEVLPEKVIFHFAEGANLEGSIITYTKRQVMMSEVEKVFEDLGLKEITTNLLLGMV